MKSTYITIGILSLLVVGAIIYAFSLAGSPFENRARKLDEERVEDISSLKNAINSFYISKSKLPETLSELSNQYLSDYQEPTKDPESGKEYEYKKISSTSYNLCTTFKTASSNESRYSYLNEFNHPKGYYCFTFKVQGSSISSTKKRTTTILDENIKAVTTDAKNINTKQSNFPYGFFSTDPNEYGLINSESEVVNVTVTFRKPVKIKSISNTFPLCGYNECETWSVVGTTSNNENKPLITDAKVPGDKTGKRITTQTVTSEEEFTSIKITMTPRLATKSHLFWEKLKIEYK